MRAILSILEGRRHCGSNSRPMGNRIAGTQGWVENVVVKKNDGGGAPSRMNGVGGVFGLPASTVKHLVLTCGP